ncbi:IME4 [[Candida] subhashii]|uniref:mRNA m(6)A methyltransferase n=1 Tax=[Candida] subhashii TaxID=561895 RepID=A0A8J5V4Y1_9ASCO|nr:IME4 [[Candida] subhashii]KAG7665494.1 IME4 [[Candida] subhashii]
MIYSKDCFVPFVEFILYREDVLTKPPIDGDLWKIRALLIQYIQSNPNHPSIQLTNISEFLTYLIQFNLISGNSLKFSKLLNSNVGLEITPPKLIWINVSGILLLKARLQGGSFPQSMIVSGIHRPQKEPKTLFELLETPKLKMDPIYSHEIVLKTSFTFNPDMLFELIKRPTARTILSKERARLKTKKVFFYNVCNDSNHNHILGTVGLNKKEYSQYGTNKQMIPQATVHQRISQSKNMISNEIYKCSQCKIHFLPIINNHTDLNLGDCSYLDTCHKMKTCRYLHYYTLNSNSSHYSSDQKENEENNQVHEYSIGDCFSESFREVLPAQWINCDIRYLPFKILGKFAAIISDPAWDIHMSLPYGTCKDEELLSLPMHELQDEGIIMLWVTGRSIEIGRRALLKWGYKISDEMIWVKLNQLKRTIVTGRTGHWLNHSKEHLLVGLKGNPIWINRKIDMDVVVSGTRETSRKPDRFYDIVERLVGIHSRKLEIFGRDHNTRPGWLTIGNQLQGVSLYEPEVKRRYEAYTQSNNLHLNYN